MILLTESTKGVEEKGDESESEEESKTKEEKQCKHDEVSSKMGLSIQNLQQRYVDYFVSALKLAQENSFLGNLQEKATVCASNSDLDFSDDTIELVMTHTRCTREEAISALLEAGGDGVIAIINLTD